MQAGEVSFPHDSSLGWIGHITSDVFWPRLVALREQALRLALPNVAGLVTGVMAKMDGVRLAAVVREQIPVTPAAWRDVQELRATEHERDARLSQAQATPFERIIQRLRKATTIGMFKIWCEGLTDGPTVDEFLTKLPGMTELGILTDSLGGWANILSPSWRPDRLRDGCHDLVVLLDGDQGRDFATPGHPLNANARRVCDILAKVGVELIVLERYGIENYFSQRACEAVLGPAVSDHFPLPLDRPANLPNHNKTYSVFLRRWSLVVVCKVEPTSRQEHDLNSGREKTAAGTGKRRRTLEIVVAASDEPSKPRTAHAPPVVRPNPVGVGGTVLTSTFPSSPADR